MLSMLLLSVGAAINCFGAACTLTRRLNPTQISALCCMGSLIALVGCAIDGLTWSASFWAACAAVHGWTWWTGGGGDGTKRRLKRWGRRFQGVRRTAPQGA